MAGWMDRSGGDRGIRQKERDRRTVNEDERVRDCLPPEPRTAERTEDCVWHSNAKK